MNQVKNPVIFHIDVNSAFLSWEANYRLTELNEPVDLRTIPSIIGGDAASRHGIVLAKSYPAKKYGIRTAETLYSALKKCPNLMIVPPRYELYESCSNAFINVIKEFTPEVEKYSIDEAYCDMTSTLHLFGSPIETAQMIRDRVSSELGITINIGISSNKTLAKMASNYSIPNSIYTMFPDELDKKFWPQPVRSLFLVGKSMEKKLNNMGIFTIGQLAGTDISILTNHFGKNGCQMHERANGIDLDPVNSKARALKGYGNSTTISQDITDINIAKHVLLSLTETVCTRLRQDHVFISTITVEIKDNDFVKKNHQCTLNSPTNTTAQVYETAITLLAEMWNNKPIRLLGLRTSMISTTANKQLDLFDSDRYEKQSKLDLAIDNIRNRYGADSVKRGTYINSPINHMIGGHHSKQPHHKDSDIDS